MLKFEVTHVPPTESDIKRARHRAVLLGVSLFIGAVTFILGTASAVLTKDASFFGGAAFGLVLIGTYMCSPTYNYDSLPDDQCGKMLQLCEKTPEGLQYRAAVIEQGRKFVCAEYQMMELWVKRISQRSACRKLYGITVESLTEPK
jgi:hypothetical protein